MSKRNKTTTATTIEDEFGQVRILLIEHMHLSLEDKERYHPVAPNDFDVKALTEIYWIGRLRPRRRTRRNWRLRDGRCKVC